MGYVFIYLLAFKLSYMLLSWHISNSDTQFVRWKARSQFSTVYSRVDWARRCFRWRCRGLLKDAHGIQNESSRNITWWADNFYRRNIGFVSRWSCDCHYIQPYSQRPLQTITVMASLDSCQIQKLMAFDPSTAIYGSDICTLHSSKVWQSSQREEIPEEDKKVKLSL
jgi:hypothetical protein